jgi:hypothetical protein
MDFACTAELSAEYIKLEYQRKTTIFTFIANLLGVRPIPPPHLNSTA